jgi:hypothetical protein
MQLRLKYYGLFTAMQVHLFSSLTENTKPICINLNKKNKKNKKIIFWIHNIILENRQKTVILM